MLSPGETLRNRDRDRNSSSSNRNSNSNSKHHQMGRFSSSLYCGIWAMCLLVVCQIGLKSQPMEFHSVDIDAPRETSRNMAVRLGVLNSNSSSNNDYNDNDDNGNGNDNDNDDNGNGNGNGNDNDTTNGLTTAGSHSPPLTDNRPWMVVHVGPPKTGTTTIQQGLFKPIILRMLARQDNVYYLGARMISSNPTTRVFLARHVLFPGSNSDLKKVLREHQQAGHNVVISSEHYTSKINARGSSASWRKRFFEHALLGKPVIDRNVVGYPENDSDNDNDDDDNDNHDNDNDKVEDIGPFWLPRRLQSQTQPQPQPQSQSQSQSQTPMEPYENQEPFFGFRVKIVVTYRHFFDWITSQHHQRYLLHGGKRIKTEEDKRKTYTAGIVEYIEDYLRHAALDDKDDDLYGPKKQQQQLLRDGNDDFITDSSARGAIPFREALSILPQKRMTDALYDSDGAKYNGLSGSLFAYRKFLSSAELYDRVDVFDMHQQPLEPPNNYNTNTTTTNNNNSANANGDPGLLANFVCQSLPAANRTCAMLRHDALAADGKRRHNTVMRSRNNSLSVGPSAQDMSRVLWHLRWKLTDLFDPTVPVSRPQFSSLVLAIDKWFEGAGNGGEGNGEPREVPKICLEGENLERLKKVSLDYLAEMYRLVRKHSLRRRKIQKHSLRRRKIQQQQQQQLENNNGNNNSSIGSSIYEYGYHGRSLFRSSHSRDHLLLSHDYDGTELPVVSFANNNNNNNSGQAGGGLPLPEHIIAAHNAEFDRYVAKGKYCQLDLEPLLSDPVFVDYVTEPLRHWDERNSIAHTESVRFRKLVSSTIPIVHPDTPPGDAFSTMNRERNSPSPSPSKPSAHSRWTFHPKSATVTFHRSPKQFSSHKPSTCNPPLQLLPSGALSKDSAVPSSVHAKDSAIPNSVHAYSQAKPTIYGAHSLTYDSPAVCITKRHCDAIKLKLCHLHATLLVANWTYEDVA
eukprot:jgi/Psemu1/23436/gm1.23436_g